MKLKLFVFTAIILAVGALSFAQRKPDTEKPIRGDFKITIRNTIAGQSTQTTTMRPPTVANSRRVEAVRRNLVI